jgi:DNA-binding MarR family transcriptional regulator
MITKIIEIKDNKAFKILKSLESIDFIEIKNKPANMNRLNILLSLKPKNQAKVESFFDLKGLWKNRDITLKQIRDKAWGLEENSSL